MSRSSLLKTVTPKRNFKCVSSLALDDASSSQLPVNLSLSQYAFLKSATSVPTSTTKTKRKKTLLSTQESSTGNIKGAMQK